MSEKPVKVLRFTNPDGRRAIVEEFDDGSAGVTYIEDGTEYMAGIYEWADDCLEQATRDVQADGFHADPE